MKKFETRAQKKKSEQTKPNQNTFILKWASPTCNFNGPMLKTQTHTHTGSGQIILSISLPQISHRHKERERENETYKNPKP